MWAGQRGGDRWFDQPLDSMILLWATLAGCVLWLIVLTVVVAVRCRRDGEPVFTRLRNGRVRFTWGIPQLLWHAQRRAERLDRTPRRPSITVGELLTREQTEHDPRSEADAPPDTAPDSPPRSPRGADTPPGWG